MLSKNQGSVVRGQEGLRNKGFTLIEILVAIFILVLTMSILHGTFIFTSHAHKSVESISDNLSSLNGALELIKKDLRYLHPSHFIGRKGYIEVLSFTPLHLDNEPYIQKVSYAVEGSVLVRKSQIHRELAEEKKIIILDNLDFFDIEFFDKKGWKREWDYGKSRTMPDGIRLTIGYRGKTVVMILKM